MSVVQLLRFDPLSVLVASLRGECVKHGVTGMRPQPGLLDDDDGGDFELPLSLALATVGLLPLIVKQGAVIFEEADLERAGRHAFPFDTRPNVEGLLGLEVIVRESPQDVEVAILCCGLGLSRFIERGEIRDGILTLVG